MSERKEMFSDSWHRVAPERLRLNPAVEVSRQVFRGQVWFLLRDPLNNEFFRISPAAYAFVGRLKGTRTVDEIWQECLGLMPDEAPGQEEVIQVLSQLHRSNLLHSNLAPDSRQLFERQRKARTRKVRGQAMNFLFLNIPLFDPDRLLTALRPIFRPFLSRVGFVVWLGIVGSAIWTAIGHFDALADQSSGVLAPGNLIYLYACTVFIKLIHELGHGIVCKHFGGEVRTTGIMLMLLTPLPYVDATSSWGFRRRWQRIAVDAAGMGAEFLIASVALYFWLTTQDEFANRLAYNVLFIASVSTVLFNANPLLRFDGYYIFSDLFDLPNLYQRATRQLKHLGERYLFGVRKSFTPATDRREEFWLTVYGIAAFIYRVFLLAFITYHVAQGFLGLGIAIAAFCVFLYFLMPIGKLVHYLVTSDRLARHRRRAFAVTACLVAGLIGVVGFVPLPRSFRASGVIKPEIESVVYNQSAGVVAEVLVPSPHQVKAGDPLVRLSNPELDLEIESAASRLDQLTTQMEEARQNQYGSIIGSLIEQAKVGRMAMEELQRQRSDLMITAPISGIWTSPRTGELAGTWAPRGTDLGRIVDFSGLIFVAAVPQKQADSLFDGSIQRSEVRLYQDASETFQVTGQSVVPGGQEKLPTAALGWLAGGEIQTRKGDNTGVAASEEFYLIRSTLLRKEDGALLPGALTGQIRFSLPPEPLKAQWGRSLRRLFQQETDS